MYGYGLGVRDLEMFSNPQDKIDFAYAVYSVPNQILVITIAVSIFILVNSSIAHLHILELVTS